MKLILKFIIFLFLAKSALAGGGDSTTIINGGDATEMTQLLNNGLLKENSNYQSRILDSNGQQLIKQAEMVANQLSQINNMIQNSRKITNPSWSQTTNLLQQLARIVGQGQALSYTSQNIDDKFKQLYPGYKTSKNFSQDYRNWSTSSMDSIRGTLNAANLQANDFATEDQLINQLQNLSQDSEGRMQAIQVGNMIAIENVQQMRKLRQLQMAQIQAQANFLAKQEQQQFSKQASQDSFFDVVDPTAGKAYKRFFGGSKR